MDTFRHHNCNINVLDVEILETTSLSPKHKTSVQQLCREERRAAGTALRHPANIRITASLLDDCSHLSDYLL